MPGLGRSIKSKDNTGIIISGDGVSVSYGAIDKPVPLQIPFKPGSIRDTVDSLLIWESRLTDLIGRDEEKKELKAWINNDRPKVSIRTIYGQGGVGKTRLAFEFAEEIRKEGWEAGQLPLSKNGLQYRFGDKGTLLIIDYPEQQTRQLQLLLKAIKKTEEPPEGKLLRILLLSRSEGFIKDLAEEVHSLFDKPLPLSTIDSKEYSWQLFQQAFSKIDEVKKSSSKATKPDKNASGLYRQLTLKIYQRFSGFFKVKAQPELPLPIDKNTFQEWQEKHPLHHTPLFILAYALNLVEDLEQTDLTGGEVIKGLVARETKRLKLEAADNELDGKSLIILKALAGISGDLNKEQINALVEETELDSKIAENIEKLSVWQPTFTDETGKQFPGQLPRMQPDLLAAALLAETLATQEQSGLLQYAALNITGDIAQACSQLGRLMYDATQVLCSPWPFKALNKYVKNDAEKCRKIAGGLDRNSLENTLYDLSVIVFKTLVEQETEQEILAEDLNSLSLRYAKGGDRVDGLKAIKKSVSIFRGLAKNKFSTYGSKLAMSLNNLSNQLAETGDHMSGLKAIQEAVDIRDKLVEDRSADYDTKQAMILNNLSVHLARNGDYQSGLKAINQAVGIYENLAEAKFAAYAPDLAMSLNNLSVHLARNGDYQGGLKAINQAVDIYENLAEVNFASYGPDLAMSLNNQSNRFNDNDDRESGLEVVQRAVDLRRDLAKINFQAYGPDLSMSLNNLSVHLGKNGEQKRARKELLRAIETMMPFAKKGTLYAERYTILQQRLKSFD